MSTPERKLVFKCPLWSCPNKIAVYTPVEYAPWCFGKEGTHSKEMEFVPDESVGEPDYKWQKKKKSAT